MTRLLKDIFPRGIPANIGRLTVKQAVNTSDVKLRKSVRAMILMACVTKQAKCFNDLWPELATYPDAEATWEKIAKNGFAPQALNKDDIAGRMFITYYQ